MAGCTDPGYGDSTCPHKDNSGQQLLGLVQCSDSQVNGTALWSACPGPKTKTALGAPSQCSCSGTTAGLLWMTTSLSALATLPTTIGETIEFNDGHYPTVKTSTGAATASAGISTSTPNGSAATATPTTQAASANMSTNSLSTGAEVGIGIGALLIGLCIMGFVISSILVYCRESSSRRGKHPSATENIDRHGDTSQIVHHSSSPGSTILGTNIPNCAWNTYTGYKSELPANSQYWYRSELPADDISPAPVPAPAPSSVLQPHTRGTELVSPLSPGDLDLIARRSPRPVSERSNLELSASRPQAGGWHGSGFVSVQERTGSDGGRPEPFSELHE